MIKKIIYKRPNDKRSQSALYLNFDNTADYVDYLINSKHPNGMDTHAVTYDSEKEGGFCSASWESALSMLQNGLDMPNVAEVRRAACDKLETLIQYAENTRYDVQGAFVDIGRYLDNEPECMVDFVTEKVQRAGLKIRINMTVPANVDQSIIFNRACAISSLIDSLRAHYDIDLSVVIPTSGVEFGALKHDNLFLEYTIDTDNGYSFQQLLATTHQSFLRRLFLRTEDIETQQQKCRETSYGHNTREFKDWFDALEWGKAETLYFPSIGYETPSSGFDTLDNAIKNVLETAKKQNLELA